MRKKREVACEDETKKKKKTERRQRKKGLRTHTPTGGEIGGKALALRKETART